MRSILAGAFWLLIGIIIGAGGLGLYGLKFYSETATEYKVRNGSYIVHILYMDNHKPDLKIVKPPQLKWLFK